MKKLLLLFVIAAASATNSNAQDFTGNASAAFGIINPKLRVQYEAPLQDRASFGASMNYYFVNWTGPVVEPFIRIYGKRSGNGEGFTLNVDLSIGSGDDQLIKAIKDQLKPAMNKFKPEFILVSAGFDAHDGDLLGELNYTSNGYKQVALILKDIAQKYASGRTLYMLEGGYVADNISQSVKKILSILGDSLSW